MHTCTPIRTLMHACTRSPVFSQIYPHIYPHTHTYAFTHTHKSSVTTSHVTRPWACRGSTPYSAAWGERITWAQELQASVGTYWSQFSLPALFPLSLMPVSSDTSYSLSPTLGGSLYSFAFLICHILTNCQDKSSLSFKSILDLTTSLHFFSHTIAYQSLRTGSHGLCSLVTVRIGLTQCLSPFTHMKPSLAFWINAILSLLTVSFSLPDTCPPIFFPFFSSVWESKLRPYSW